MKVRTVSLLLAAAVLLPGFASESLAQRTTRRNLHAAPSATAAAAAPESAGGAAALRMIKAPDAADISVRGYDKPLRSRRETFFVTNNLKKENLKRLYMSFTYLDASGRMLHSEQRELDCDLPPAETRQFNVPSWDVQQNFYFVRSTVSNRAAQATPFDVKISVDSVAVAP